MRRMDGDMPEDLHAMTVWFLLASKHIQFNGSVDTSIHKNVSAGHELASSSFSKPLAVNLDARRTPLLRQELSPLTT